MKDIILNDESAMNSISSDNLQKAKPQPFPKILWTIPLLLAAVVGLFTIDGKFVQDDYAAIVMNPIVIQDIPFWEAFRRDFWGLPINQTIFVWRPLLPIIWKLLWSIQPNDPLLFRILSLLLHVSATASVILLGRKLIADRRMLWTTGAVFAVHAVHSEAIGGIVSHADILSTTLGLLALLAALGRPGFLQAFSITILFALACLAKESAVVFGPIIILIVALQENQPLPKRITTLIPVGTVMIFMIAFQLSLDRSTHGGGLDNLARAAHGWDRLFYGLYIVGRAISMCFIPAGLAPNHGYAAVDFRLQTLLPYAIPGLLFLASGIFLFIWTFKSRNLPWITGLGLLFGPVLLHSNLIMDGIGFSMGST
jgi:hypothetical protein